MSELSRILLQNSIDYSAISQKRVENYGVLASELKEFALFPSLTGVRSPWIPDPH